MKVIVFGSFVVDLTSRSEKLPIPGETVLGSVFKSGPGGKGSNQAVAAHRAGGDVLLATKIGDDVFGKTAIDFYEKEGMDTRYVWTSREKETGTALILVEEQSGQNMIVVTLGACGSICEQEVLELEKEMKDTEYLLVQLETEEDTLEQVTSLAEKYGVKIVLNPAPARPLSPILLSRLEIITPNETEAQALTGIKVENSAEASRASHILLDQGVKSVIITMGDQGAFVSDGVHEAMLEAIPVSVADTTGAGDAFNGCLVCALAEGRNLYEAAKFANAAGALCVSRVGTAPAMPERVEIDALYQKIYMQDQIESSLESKEDIA